MLRAPVLAALALILGGLFVASHPASGSQPFAVRGTVTAIVDPATLDVLLADGTGKRVELFGIGAPRAASCALAQAMTDTSSLARGRPVWLVAVQGTARRSVRGPLVAYVILPGGLDLGLELVKRGDVTVRANQHPFKQLAAYLGAQSDARASSLGVWGCAKSHAPGGPKAPPTAPGGGQGQNPSPSHGQDHGRSDRHAGG